MALQSCILINYYYREHLQQSKHSKYHISRINQREGSRNEKLLKKNCQDGFRDYLYWDQLPEWIGGLASQNMLQSMNHILS